MYTTQQERAHIRELQEMLRRLSFYLPAVPRIVPDGVYGEATAHAVREFQQFAGLRQTGEVNSATWEKLAALTQELTETVPVPLEVFPPQQGAVLLPGEEGLAVAVTQCLLHALAARYGLPDTPITGILDPDTQNAVRQFQKCCGLEVTGCVDRGTWDRLALLNS